MKKNLSLASLITCLLLSGFTSFAQMVGDCAFLKGKFLELGLAPNGAFGSTRAAPTGYHPGTASHTLYDPLTGTTTSVGQIGFIADPDQNGWTVGTPAKFGDFFLPGTPQEGWSIQVGGVKSDAWLTNLQFAGTGYTGTLSGTTFSYSSSGTMLTAVWKGQTTNPLQITQTTNFDTTKLYFTVNVKIKNAGGTTANNVYYLRTLDPDNEEEQTPPTSFTGFNTQNTIAYQLPNPANKVMVTAVGGIYTQAFLGLGTKDCRAKCFVINGSLTPGANLAACYNATSGYNYALGFTQYADEGIGLVYTLGNIAPNDSVDLTFAYVMRNADLDSALNATSPAVLANSNLLLPGADTINACTALTDSIPVNITNGAGYNWTWAPATGLTATTGTSTIIDLSAVTTITTYTLIGVPISGALCSNDTFNFTVISGISGGPAVANLNYCQNDAAPALTAGGTNLLWYTAATGGTGSATAPIPSTAVPGVYTWWVTQHVGLCTESVRVPITVTVNALPSVTAGSNSPVCQYNTLYLFATTTTTGTGIGYSWSGPGFSSSLQNPSISGVPVSATGNYTVVMTLNGCADTSTVAVVIKPTPTITFTTQTNPSACNVSDGSITLNGLTADSVYTVVYTLNGTTNYTLTFTANPSGQIILPNLHAGIYGNIFVTGTNGCPSNAVTVTLPDGAAPTPPLLSSNGPVCADSTLLLFATSTISGVTYQWSGPGGFSSTQQNPVRTGVNTGANGNYYCTVTILATGCVSTAGLLNVVVHATPTNPAITSNSPVCEGTTLTLNATSSPSGSSFSWQGPASFTSGVANPSINHAAVTNSGTYTVVATQNGCPSLPGHFTATVNPIPGMPTPNDVAYCQYDLASPLTATGASLLWYTVPAAGSSSSSAPVPSTNFPGVTNYYVSQTLLGCESPRTPLAVTVKVKPVVEISTTNGAVCQSDTMTYTSIGPVYPGASYLWTLPPGASFANGSDSIAGPVDIRFDSAFNRAVQLTITYNGCSSTGSNTMFVVPTPTLNLYAQPNICVDDTISVALTTTTYFPVISNYTWTFSGANVVTAASGGGGPYSIAWYTPGVYVVHVTGYTAQSSCPSQSMSDTVRVHAAPVATFTSGSVACSGDTLVLTATETDPSYTYSWTPAPFFTGLGAVNAPVATANVMFPGYISLTVTSPFGCTATDSMMYNPMPCCIVSFPTAFTPNGDGSNDRFRPITSGHHTLSVFRVANRWGATVFETTTTDTYGWDGTYGGVPQDMDTYYYFIRYTCDGHVTEESGSVILIR